MKTLIRLLLQEQSDLGLHCLPRPICPKNLRTLRGNFTEKLQTATQPEGGWGKQNSSTLFAMHHCPNQHGIMLLLYYVKLKVDGTVVTSKV